MKSSLTTLLGIEHPIIQAPIGSASNAQLTAAVSNAGGLGMLALSWSDPEQTREEIKKTKMLTEKPFGVNLVLQWDQEERIRICEEEGVPVISFFWGDSSPYIGRLQKKGIRVCHSVGSADEAKFYEEKGIDFIVAQGWEAGGHIWGKVSIAVLVPAIVNQVKLPVVAAGGIADGRGMLAALALGAAGVWLGTRFLMSREANVSPVYQELIAAAKEIDTVHCDALFNIGWDHAPHRVIRNSTVTQWEKAGKPSSGNRPGENEIVAYRPNGTAILRYSDDTPLAKTTGKLESLALYAGQSAGLLQEAKGAADIINELVAQTIAEKERINQLF